MIEYVRVEDGEIVEVGLPEVGRTLAGATISGYHLLPEEVLLQEGWVPVVDEGPPEHDENISSAERILVVVDQEVHAQYQIQYHYQDPSLTVDVYEFPADGAAMTTVTYDHPNPIDRPDDVIFYVNDEEPITIELLPDGKAHLDVSAIIPGNIEIYVEGLSLEVTATEVTGA